MNSFSLDPGPANPSASDPEEPLRASAGNKPGLSGAGLPPRPVRWGETYAALDLGTNNCRLLVARASGPGFRVIDAFSRIVRLGEGLNASGLLSDAAMERTIEALKICAGKIAQRGVTRSRYVATEACRRAANCDDFLGRVEAETGIAIETITTGEEARLAVNGCAPLLQPTQPYAIVFDIGGGSTELVWLRQAGRRAPEILGTISLPFGVVTLTERYGGDVFATGTWEAMVAEAEGAMTDFASRCGGVTPLAVNDVQMLGSSGTVTTLAGIHLGLARYNRSLVDGTNLSFTSIRAVSGNLARMNYAERAAHPCIGRERADLVVAGCAILEAICRLWPVGSLGVADRGVREGILLDLLAAPGQPRA
jgi:exopolyphosphatase/guanosine-5'-triphosphate,3'-diphosphate pyrophosphatase